VYCLVLDSLLNGSCRIDERGTSLSDAFVGSLEAHGGRVETGARVTRILHDGSGVQGVRLADGEDLPARNVVFTGHPRQLLDLCAGPGLRPGFKKRLRDSFDTPGAFGLCLSWRGGANPVAASDALLYDDWDTGRHYRQRLVSQNEAPHAIYCAGAGQGGASMVALCLCPPEEWSRWEDTRTGFRPPGYHAAKAAVADRVLASLERHWPDIRNRVEVLDTFTPLTLRDYTLAPGGTAYGMKKTGTVPLPSRTRIPGLFLAGHSVILSGVLGAVISGVSACRGIVSEEPLLAAIRAHSR
jgi:all-trans-retinol 13,14-reductase